MAVDDSTTHFVQSVKDCLDYLEDKKWGRKGPDKENLAKPGQQPFDEFELTTELRNRGYGPYVYYRFAPTSHPESGFLYMKYWLTPAPNDWEDLLKDCVARTGQDTPSDARFKDDHKAHVGPVRDHMKSNLLKLSVEKHHVLAKIFAGKGVGAKDVTIEQIKTDVAAYMDWFIRTLPARYRNVKGGEFRVEEGHEHDPKNPHNFKHVHVHHKTEPYYVTIRLEADKAVGKKAKAAKA